MTHAKCQALKINGCAFKVPKALKHRSSTSFLPPLGAKSGVPSCIVGVAVGNQVIQSHIKVGSYPMTEEKAHANKYIQASLGEEENILEKFKSLQKENLQLKGTLKEKDSTISRLMKTTKGQAAEYNTVIELEKEHQKEIERQLKESEHLVKEKTQLLDEIIQHYTKILQEQHIKHAELVFEMKKQNEVDVRNREDKIVKLKQYIADTFQEKSREHQQQMDELRTELNRFEEKMHILKTKLGKEIRSRKGSQHYLVGIQRTAKLVQHARVCFGTIFEQHGRLTGFLKRVARWLNTGNHRLEHNLTLTSSDGGEVTIMCMQGCLKEIFQDFIQIEPCVDASIEGKSPE